MKKDYELYRPGELGMFIDPDEDLRYSFHLSPCKRNWLGLYTIPLGVGYH